MLWTTKDMQNWVFLKFPEEETLLEIDWDFELNNDLEVEDDESEDSEENYDYIVNHIELKLDQVDEDDIISEDSIEIFSTILNKNKKKIYKNLKGFSFFNKIKIKSKPVFNTYDMLPIKLNLRQKTKLIKNMLWVKIETEKSETYKKKKLARYFNPTKKKKKKK